MLMHQNFSILTSYRRKQQQQLQNAATLPNKAQVTEPVETDETKNQKPFEPAQSTQVLINFKSVKMVDSVHKQHEIAEGSQTKIRSKSGAIRGAFEPTSGQKKAPKTAQDLHWGRPKDQHSYARADSSSILQTLSRGKAALSHTEDLNKIKLDMILAHKPPTVTLKRAANEDHTTLQLQRAEFSTAFKNAKKLHLQKMAQSSNLFEVGSSADRQGSPLGNWSQNRDSTGQDLEYTKDDEDESMISGGGSQKRQASNSPPHQMTELYSKLVPFKMQVEPIVRANVMLPIETQNLLRSLTFSVVGVKDRMLFKMLKSNDAEVDRKKGTDFTALRNLLYKKQREDPDDPCLLHNKAVLYAYKHQNEAADAIFGELQSNERAVRILEPGWQLNWAIVLLRMGDYQHLNQVLQSLLNQENVAISRDFMRVKQHNDSMLAQSEQQMLEQERFAEEQQRFVKQSQEPRRTDQSLLKSSASATTQELLVISVSGSQRDCTFVGTSNNANQTTNRTAQTHVGDYRHFQGVDTVQNEDESAQVPVLADIGYQVAQGESLLDRGLLLEMQTERPISGKSREGATAQQTYRDLGAKDGEGSQPTVPLSRRTKGRSNSADFKLEQHQKTQPNQESTLGTQSEVALETQERLVESEKSAKRDSAQQNLNFQTTSEQQTEKCVHVTDSTESDEIAQPVEETTSELQPLSADGSQASGLNVNSQQMRFGRGIIPNRLGSIVLQKKKHPTSTELIDPRQHIGEQFDSPLIAQMKVNRKMAQYYKDLVQPVQPLSPSSLEQASNSQNSKYNYLGPQRGKLTMERSESNIYLEPKSPKQRQFKPVHRVGDKVVEYQEINSSGASIGPLLNKLPEDQSLTMSKRSIISHDTPQDASPCFINVPPMSQAQPQTKGGPLGGGGVSQWDTQHAAKPSQVIQDDQLEIVHEMNEAENKSVLSSPAMLKEKKDMPASTTAPQQQDPLCLGSPLQTRFFLRDSGRQSHHRGGNQRPESPQPKTEVKVPHKINIMGKELTFGKNKDMIKLIELPRNTAGNGQENDTQIARAREDPILDGSSLVIDGFQEAINNAATNKQEQSHFDVTELHSKKQSSRLKLGQSKSHAQFELIQAQEKNQHTSKQISRTNLPPSRQRDGANSRSELVITPKAALSTADARAQEKQQTPNKHGNVFQSQRQTVYDSPFKQIAYNAAFKEKKSLATASAGDHSDLASAAQKHQKLRTRVEDPTSSEGFAASVSALGEYAIKAVSMLRQNFNRTSETAEEESKKRNSRALTANHHQRAQSMTSNPLSSMINKWFTDVERFRNKLGGSRELTQFISKLSEEGGTGEIYAKENKRKNQRARNLNNDLMPRKHVAGRTAYELATTIHEEHLHAIYFLLDLYDKKRKAFIRLLKQIDNEEMKREQDDELSANLARSVPKKSSKEFASRQSRTVTYESSTSSDNADLDEIQELRGKSPHSFRHKNDLEVPKDKYAIEHSISELALSVLNKTKKRQRSEFSPFLGQRAEQPSISDDISPADLNNQGQISSQNYQQSWYHKSVNQRVQTAHLTGLKREERLDRNSLFMHHAGGVPSPMHLNTGRAFETQKRAFELTSNSHMLLQHTEELPVRSQASKQLIYIGESPASKRRRATLSPGRDSTQRPGSPTIKEIADSENNDDEQVSFNHVRSSEQARTESEQKGNNIYRASMVQSPSTKLANLDLEGVTPAVFREPSAKLNHTQSRQNSNNSLSLGEERDSIETAQVVDPLAWQPDFKDSERVKMIDLDQSEFRDVLDLLGDTKAKGRAERLLKQMETKKLAWYKIEEIPLHEVMGIEKAQHRRMKLIMAKLGSRQEKEQKAKHASAQRKKVRFIAQENQNAPQQKNSILTKLAKFKKYYSLGRPEPEQLEQTYEEAEKLAKEKTLADLQQIVIKNLKRKALQKDSTSFINDIIAKEKIWQAARSKKSMRDDDCANGGDSSEGASSASEAPSVNLSDIKSENDSIYWEQQRGNVEEVDILINQQKLFNNDFYDDFNEGLRLLEQCVKAPFLTIQELDRANQQQQQTSDQNQRRKFNLMSAGHN